GRPKYPLRLGDGEEAGLAEDVAELREPAAGHLRERRAHDAADVLSRAAEELGSDGVRAEVRRHEPEAGPSREARDQPQQPQLARVVEAVAALHLEARRAPGGHPAEPP